MDFFLDLVKVNEEINYGMIAAIIFSYLFAIWFVISLWVFFDAKKRYSNIVTPILFTLIIIFLGPPFLVVYILIRPEHTLEEDYFINLALSGEKDMKPIIFEGEKGFDLTLNLSVQPRQTADGKHEMALQVGWMPTDLKKTSNKIKKAGPGKITSFFYAFGQTMSRSIKSIKLPEKPKKSEKIEEKKKDDENEEKKDLIFEDQKKEEEKSKPKSDGKNEKNQENNKEIDNKSKEKDNTEKLDAEVKKPEVSETEKK